MNLQSPQVIEICPGLYCHPHISWDFLWVSTVPGGVRTAWLLEAKRKGQEIHRCWKSSGSTRDRVGKTWVWKTWHTEITDFWHLECRFTHNFFFLTFWHWIHQCQASTLTCSIRIDGTMSGLGGLKLLCYHVNAKGIYRWTDGNTKIKQRYIGYICHERCHIIQVHRTRSQDKGETRFQGNFHVRVQYHNNVWPKKTWHVWDGERQRKVWGKSCQRGAPGSLHLAQPCRILLDMLYMDVSENSGTLKSSILIGFSIINHPF